MAIVEVKVPQLSESVAEATLLQWKKKAGDAVAIDEILIEVETDKVVLEVPAPAAGVLAEIVRGDGSTVAAGELIARLDTEGKASAAPAPQPAAGVAAKAAPAPAPAAGGAKSGVAMPAAAKMMADKGVVRRRRCPAPAVTAASPRGTSSPPPRVAPRVRPRRWPRPRPPRVRPCRK